ncbi:hypothetical protein ATO10_12052 [Actibacterium atlanticum]|uniref:Sulfotransferase family protein n=1 Tax=Actibacterium atlanticum TaxID=1461693 RepID=A0A058ZKA6_9RHOB|nr:hypothetical protein [Actibacterium atlanticum]KCV81645.1 hypothetical protein ATO10_12052 [Actibacterium atlanticum]
MDLILHLGAHRTGSTTFEKTLSKNAAVLRAEGTGVWTPAKVRQIEGFSSICGRQEQLAKGDSRSVLEAAIARGALQDRLNQAQESGLKTLLISEENMLGTMQRNLTILQLYDNAAWRLKTYADYFDRAPKRVVMGLRSYSSYWRSAYIFALRKRPETLFSNISYELATQPLGWCDLVQGVRKAFPEAEICLWTQEGFRNKELGIIAKALGRQNADGLEALNREANIGLGVADIPYIFRARRHKAEIADKELDRHIQRNRARGVVLPEPAMFTQDQDALMDAKYAEDIAKLRAGYLGARMLDEGAAA